VVFLLIFVFLSCFTSRKIDQLQQSFVQGHFHDLQKKVTSVCNTRAAD
jgi:hypothetical protein